MDFARVIYNLLRNPDIQVTFGILFTPDYIWIYEYMHIQTRMNIWKIWYSVFPNLAFTSSLTYLDYLWGYLGIILSLLCRAFKWSPLPGISYLTQYFRLLALTLIILYLIPCYYYNEFILKNAPYKLNWFRTRVQIGQCPIKLSPFSLVTQSVHFIYSFLYY